MKTRLRTAILPEAKRRTLEELSDDLELLGDDTIAKRSAFWTMLVLSAVIASCGVLTDSTATVIGAMIIAPLSTPIMGIGLAAVKRERNGSVKYAVLGALVVVLIGAAFSLIVPSSYDLAANPQISGRVQPGLLDMLAALATGLAGAVALARRDVAAVLPGVAIAISLVPPLAVVGVCLGQGSFAFSLGALLLFVSNLVAMVLAGMFVFTVLGYAAEELAKTGRGPGKTYVTFGVLFVAVLIPLALNSVFHYLVGTWEATAEEKTNDWLSDVPGATVQDVTLTGTTLEIDVRAPGPVPDSDSLLRSLDGGLPDGLQIDLVSTVGTTVDVGVIGE